MARKPKTAAASTRAIPKRAAKEKKPEPPKEKPSPKKVKSPKPKKEKSSPKKKKSHPTYERMVFKALKSLGGTRGGSSYAAISKFIQTKYPGVPEADKFKRYLRISLKRGVEETYFAKVKASYRLTAKGKSHFEKGKKKRSRKSKKTTESGEASKPKRKSPSKSPSKKSKKEGSASPAKKKRGSTSSESSAPSTSTSASSTSAAPLAKTGRKKSSGTSTATSKEGGELTIARPKGLKSDYLWQFFDGVWKNYEGEASDVVEDVYQKYLANRGDTDVRAVKSGQWEYMVDFMAMKQTNIQHENHTVRNIRRVKVAA